MNRLSRETSPYLRQHADNPVDWFPWGSEALHLAKDQDRPILLSIGYAACHWCHVMAHESFEDVTVAQRMNELFVNIKVDREERPDLDKVYQKAHQLLSRRPGGWPLTLFLNPGTLLPFFCGTYFPPQARYGLPGFYDLLPQVADHFRAHRDDLVRNDDALMHALNREEQPITTGMLQAALLVRTRSAALEYFDAINGGFGGAPKFPHVSLIDFLLGQWLAGGAQDRALATAIRKTLDGMADGGIYDHLGGGFYRYTVDAEWNIPHFEKMLYDNGALLSLYTRAAQGQIGEKYYRVVHETAAWVMTEMQSPDGGYYSSLDADSEGIEGLFYRWNRAEPRKLLSDEAYRLCAAYYGLDQTPNFEEHWHLRVSMPLEKAAASCAMSLQTAEETLVQARQILQHYREQRTRPGLDNKILTAWNALMIGGMAVAGRVCRRRDYIESAERAFDFIHTALVRDGLLYASSTAGVSRFEAYLDDYAFLIEAGLELVQAHWSSVRFEWLIALADKLLEAFEDKEAGGFYFTSHNHERVIVRSKSLIDEAMISGNAAAASTLLKLGHVLGEPRYLAAAERTLKALPEDAANAPDRYAGMMTALGLWLYPPETIIIRSPYREDIDGWMARIDKEYRANRICIAIPDDETALPEQLKNRNGVGRTVAYVCRGTECLAPLTDLQELADLLRK
ncbi:thioredoxin domain-containing protein [Candidatus Methylospira mobilis]|uniref:Thioredoxin domain-containing protein n=1 Tax=Candidatus Methylospira mobilis TaxID=1808979 RepID=A0A5Q0BPF7_9GAMM|nr:thioredoxin domain-containing protein [Candidatus Methylospira mobilis]QFY44171.1 thioredoxin domain-containing protein [Candidatus Methylospira mobilis]WNV06407.1 thioredoxin domain-containing protein [Candidatus Methylospira mobilis]